MIKKLRAKRVHNKELRRLGQLVMNVSENRSYSTEIRGVLITPCNRIGEPIGPRYYAKVND